MQRWTLFAFLFLLGCTPTLVWDRMARSEEQFARDKRDCQRDSRVAVNERFPPPPPPPGVEYRSADGLLIPQAKSWSSSVDLEPVFQQQAFEQRFLQACMEARGYRIAEGASGKK